MTTNSKKIESEIPNASEVVTTTKRLKTVGNIPAIEVLPEAEQLAKIADRATRAKELLEMFKGKDYYIAAVKAVTPIVNEVDNLVDIKKVITNSGVSIKENQVTLCKNLSKEDAAKKAFAKVVYYVARQYVAADHQKALKDALAAKAEAEVAAAEYSHTEH